MGAGLLYLGYATEGAVVFTVMLLTTIITYSVMTHHAKQYILQHYEKVYEKNSTSNAVLNVYYVVTMLFWLLWFSLQIAFVSNIAAGNIYDAEGCPLSL